MFKASRFNLTTFNTNSQFHFICIHLFSKRMPRALHISFRLPTVVGKTIFRTLIAIGLTMRLKTTHFVSPAENTLGFTHTKIAHPPPLFRRKSQRLSTLHLYQLSGWLGGVSLFYFRGELIGIMFTFISI